ncbi:hypothetical protein Pan44_12080 [Caulifigura coniformis]|uniref:Uncharacterized protein n=1 Tax=Caulifigura coniformis TaxID=2527983 RepID=A0A517SAQ0_9PLAN|nr:hypothetical protein [Caulifigura coniformis]QDT53192.1 hypothetical protein Pan44_12080 [Caulifigura coniformis]
MNLRDSKVIRLGGWVASAATLLATAAGGFLAFNGFQEGDLLMGSIASGVAVAICFIGGLLSYCLFKFASMQALAATAAPVVIETPVQTVEPSEDAPALDTDALAVAAIVNGTPVPAPPENSDDALPVFIDPGNASDLASDEFDEAMLVVPPPAFSGDDGDVSDPELGVENVWGDEFDSRMDLPVTGDPTIAEEEAAGVLNSDAPASTVSLSQTTAVASALTQTDEIDALIGQSPVDELPAAPSEAALPVQAFPEIFKSSPAPHAEPETPVAAPTPPAAPVAPAPAPTAATAKPAAAVPKSKAEIEAPLATAAELQDMATTLTPTLPTGGALPSEIPDFFLRMPTGRNAVPRQPMPIAPVAPRQVAPQKPAPPVAPAAVRIIDSSTVADADDDLVTLTSIPDDWPS